MLAVSNTEALVGFWKAALAERWPRGGQGRGSSSLERSVKDASALSMGWWLRLHVNQGRGGEGTEKERGKEGQGRG